MTNIRNVLLVGLAWAIAIPAASMGAANGVPGGITLVPGTVVIPGVGGSAVTGTVPLAGTPGSPGLVNLDPGLAPPNRATSGDAGSLYPPTYYPQTGLPPGTVQSTLPPYAPATPGLAAPEPSPNSVAPGIATCPSGATVSNGTC